MPKKNVKLNSCLVDSNGAEAPLNDARMKDSVIGVGMDSGAGFRLGGRNDG